MAINLTTVFPPEIITHIVSYIDIEDYVFLKLSCKTLAAFMPLKLPDLIRKQHPSSQIKTRGISQSALVFFNVHQKLESRARDLLPAEPIKLLCFWCGLIKCQEAFLDAARAKPIMPVTHDGVRFTGSGRNCVNCKILYHWRPGKYAHSYNGVRSFGCCACLQMRPMKDWIQGRDVASAMIERAPPHWRWQFDWREGRMGVCKKCNEGAKSQTVSNMAVGEQIKQLRERTESFWTWVYSRPEL